MIKEIALIRVPAIALIFWMVKRAAATLEEVGGDAVSMSMDLRYLLATAFLGIFFIVAVIARI
jgi:uncharacterized membrane-anchored protein